MTDTSPIAATLQARLAELQAGIARLEVEVTAPLDADFSEQANELEEQETLVAREAAMLDEINAIHLALRRIADGSYGKCANCGCEIPAARMAAMPAATECIKCAAE